MVNRLNQKKSLYLLQHGENPVDWYPWCKEAFARGPCPSSGLGMGVRHIGWSRLSLRYFK